jgi:hypothetical protein
MSNKSQLQTNNTTLDGYIARVNAAKEVAAGLPEVGGGSVAVETCTFEFTKVGFGDTIWIAYTGVDESGNMVGLLASAFGAVTTITCVKGTTVAIVHHATITNISFDVGNGLSLLNNTNNRPVYAILNDAGDFITLSMSGRYDT